MIKCQICGKKFKLITWRHLLKHGITIEEYKEKYGGLCSDEFMENLKKKKFHSRVNEFYGI